MKPAKAIADVPAPSQSSKIQKQKMENIHSACNKLTKPANVDLRDHMHAKGLQQRNFELKTYQHEVAEKIVNSFIYL